MSMRSALFPLCAAAAVIAAAGSASAQNVVSTPPADAGYAGVQSQTNALITSNPAAYSNPVFRSGPPAPINEAYSGSSLPPAPRAHWTGTETNPPGANGPEMPGAQANGSTMGQAAD